MGDDDVSMIEVYETDLTISNVVDLSGKKPLNEDLSLDDTCLIPKDPFKDVDPDDREYEGYMGNVRFQLFISLSDRVCRNIRIL